jgi:hypothetical protein
MPPLKEQTIAPGMSAAALAAALRGRWRRLEIDPSLDPAALNAILDMAASLEGAGPVLQLLATHPSANEALLERITDLAEVKSEWGALNAVATAPGTPERILRRLAGSPNRFVAQHAALALVTGEMDHADPLRFREILDEHASDSEDDAAVRSILALHPRAPEAVLEILVEDAEDTVAEAARERLGRSGPR